MLTLRPLQYGEQLEALGEVLHGLVSAGLGGRLPEQPRVILLAVLAD